MLRAIKTIAMTVVFLQGNITFYEKTTSLKSDVTGA